MKSRLIIWLALALCGGLFGCSSAGPKFASGRERRACETIVSAINRGDWQTLRGLAKPGMRANEYIVMWEKNHERVGALVRVDKDANYYADGKPCMIYSFAWDGKDGTANMHKLQILTREENGKAVILDFWNFGW